MIIMIYDTLRKLRKRFCPQRLHSWPVERWNAGGGGGSWWPLTPTPTFPCSHSSQSNRSNAALFVKRNDPYTHFSQQFNNKLTWLVIFYYFFTKINETKQKNNKILPVTSACCGIIVRNECRNHFSFVNYWLPRRTLIDHARANTSFFFEMSEFTFVFEAVHILLADAVSMSECFKEYFGHDTTQQQCLIFCPRPLLSPPFHALNTVKGASSYW
jgi:hypothetical protein